MFDLFTFYFALIVSAFLLGFIFWHFRIFERLYTVHKDEELVRSLIATNYLPSLKASYKKNSILCIGLFLFFAFTVYQKLTYGDSSDSEHMILMSTLIFTFYGLTIGLAYRLILNHRLLSRMLKMVKEK